MALRTDSILIELPPGNPHAEVAGTYAYADEVGGLGKPGWQQVGGGNYIVEDVPGSGLGAIHPFVEHDAWYGGAVLSGDTFSFELSYYDDEDPPNLHEYHCNGSYVAGAVAGLVKETGAGVAGANSYADVDDGNRYHAMGLYAKPWQDATDEQRAAALVMATRVIDALYQFNGYKVSAAQSLEWPRVQCPDVELAEPAVIASNIVPGDVMAATCEMARELLLVDRTAAPPGEGITEQRNADASATVYSKGDTRPIISHLAQAMLGKYGRLFSEKGNGGGTVRVVRV